MMLDAIDVNFFPVSPAMFFRDDRSCVAWNEILLIRSEALRSTLELFAGRPNRSALDMEEEPCKRGKVGEV